MKADIISGFLRESGKVKELSKASDIVRALTRADLKEESKLYFPERKTAYKITVIEIPRKLTAGCISNNTVGKEEGTVYDGFLLDSLFTESGW